MKVAVLDDYQRVALEYADWKSLQGVEVTVFNEPLVGSPGTELEFAL